MRKEIKKGLIICFVLSMFLVSFVSAQEFDQVISNSEDWKDVYSTMLYSNLLGKQGHFLVSTKHGDLLLNSIKRENSLRIVTSKENQYVPNYPSKIEAEGFEGVDEKRVDSANLELIRDMENIDSFIVVGDSYGYNAMAVAPYAITTNSWVFLANERNIYEIDSILSERNVENIIVYGFVDGEVRDVLSKYNPETINNENKFENNIEVVKKYIKKKPQTKQVLLTNGEFIEKELMAGKNPTLFTGRENVPGKIADYLKNSDLEVGVLIGNSLIGAATNIRRDTGLSVMAKFARGARSQEGGVAAVEGLNLFPLPTPTISLEAESVKYNKATSMLEVTYNSQANVPFYLEGTITLNSGEESTRVGDDEPVFMTPGDYRTITYPVNMSPSENMSADVYTLYGESADALDRVLEKTIDVGVIDVLDKCDLDVSEDAVEYNKQKDAFIVDIKNVADVDCWVDVELEDVFFDYQEQTIGTEEAVKISAGDKEKVYIEREMSDKDLKKNEFIDLTVHFGERKESLVKVLKGSFKLMIRRFTTLTYVIAGLVLVIIALMMYMGFLKRKEDSF